MAILEPSKPDVPLRHTRVARERTHSRECRDTALFQAHQPMGGAAIGRECQLFIYPEVFRGVTQAGVAQGRAKGPRGRERQIERGIHGNSGKTV